MRLPQEIGRLVLRLAADLAMSLVIEGLTRLSKGASALADLLERDDEDLDEPANELLTHLQQMLVAGAQVRYDPKQQQPWFLLLGTREIASATSLVDLVLQARTRRAVVSSK